MFDSVCPVRSVRFYGQVCERFVSIINTENLNENLGQNGPINDSPALGETAAPAETESAQAAENAAEAKSLSDFVSAPKASPAAPAAASDEPIIEFEGVYKTYPTGTHALRDMNIRVNKGEFVFIVGASGAGKSTFMKLVMHEEKPNAGRIMVNGFDVTRMKRREVPKFRRTMGIVFQDFRLIPNMDVFNNVAFAMRVVGVGHTEIRRRVAQALNLVGLSGKARSKPAELSGGEQQRVGLARALVNNPSLIIADEPTGNVDPNMSYEIVELLTEINRRGTTVLMVTHEHQLVRDFGRRVIMIENGTVVADNEGGEE